MLSALALAVSVEAGLAREPSPPRAARIPVTSEHHGVKLVDDYGWLRTARPNAVVERPEALEPRIRRHFEAEARYATAMLAPNRALERQLIAEMRGRLSADTETVPETRGPWEFYSRYDKGAQRRTHLRRPRGGGAEQVMLDENVLARGRRAFSLDEMAISPDFTLLAYTADEDGSERPVLRIRDLATGRDLPDVIPDVHGSFTWSSDGQWLIYVRRDAEQWARSAHLHRLGTRVAEDKLIYEEKQEGFTVALAVMLSRRYAALDIGDFSTNEVRLVDLADPAQPPRPVTPRTTGERYAVSDLGDKLVVATNAGAIDWKIGIKPLAAAAGAPLQEIVPHKPGRLIEGVVVLSDHLVWLERDRDTARQRLVARRWSNGEEHDASFGEAPAKVELSSGLEQNTATVRFTYESMAQPRQVFDYDLAGRQRILRKTRDVPSGHDPARYVTRRIEAPARDGATVPVTVLYRRDTPLDGSAPVWLYGYGSYGDTQYPDFATGRLSLVDRGFIYAFAGVRGGGEKGQAWHDAGRLANKHNTFSDFVAAAEHLIAQGLTRAGRIVASGASAGGTLVGAVANMRPDLFGAIYADAPFVDALNTLLDRSLPLTEASFSEFGNPIDSKELFEVIRAYAPYENVKAQAYPPMLVTQNVNDARVPYWEAAKWVVKLRQYNTGRNPVILQMKMRGGHGGGSGRFDEQEDIARAYAFGLGAVGYRDAAVKGRR